MSFLRIGCLLEESSTAVACCLWSSCVKWLQLDCEFLLEVQALTVGWRWSLTLHVDVCQSPLPAPRSPVTWFDDKVGVRFPSSADRMNTFSFWGKWVVTAFISLCVPLESCSFFSWYLVVLGRKWQVTQAKSGLDTAIGLCHCLSFVTFAQFCVTTVFSYDWGGLECW